MKRYVAAIDQGTTSSRCMVFDVAGRPVACAQKEHRQIFPRPGWVEHDALEIWRNVETVVAEALSAADARAEDIAAVGITNQRETTLLWERASGEPIGPAIVWQDTRTDKLIRRLGGEDGQDQLRPTCGLPLATYFSAPKICWMLEQDRTLRARAERGEILFGTMDAWLIWRLTGRHLTDVTNASRTMLMSLRDLSWDEDALGFFDIPRAMLPQILPSSALYGTCSGILAGAPLAGVLGDQQAALFGQACFSPGDAKCTYGTGGFLLANTGLEPVASRHGLITTLAYQVGESDPVYALEGSIAVAGSLVQWFRDNVGLVDAAPDIEALAASVADSGGCYFVPAFSGLYAPYWRAEARGVIAGLTGYVTKAHLARAVLEATCWQVREVVEAMILDGGARLTRLRADGGMTANNLLMQLQADILNAPVVRPEVIETTCLGAAYAAGLAVGFWPDQAALASNWRASQAWSPSLEPSSLQRRYGYWKKAVRASMDWIEEDDP